MSDPITPDSKQANPILWTEHDEPYSSLYGDVYFTQRQGLEESRYVFLEHNRLNQRFQALSSHQHFTIAETGFGAGLNFLATWQLWNRCAPPQARLIYLSTELHPLTADDLIRAHRLWPELCKCSQTLLSEYRLLSLKSPSLPFYSLNFGQVRLQLMLGDSLTCMKQLLCTEHPDFAKPQTWGVDAWYFDGFAPQKNPDMWSQALFDHARVLSKPNSSFATFTASGMVRRQLKQAGFTVNKSKGFGHKREMLWGCWMGNKPYHDPSEHQENGTNAPETLLKAHKNPFSIQKKQTPWHRPKDLKSLPVSSAIAIIGGGLAGCNAAYALAKRGYQVTLFDRCSALAQEGSGNPQAVLYCKLSAHPGHVGDFNFLALHYAQRFYHP